MFAFLNRGRPEIDHSAGIIPAYAPGEPSTASELAAAHRLIADTIAHIDRLVAAAPTASYRDALLDVRLMLKPPRPATVPVVPGPDGEGGACRA
jgi:hypothetical protein